MGLGHKFLKHVERTRLNLHLIDGAHLLEFSTRPDEDSTAQAKKGAEEIFRVYQAIRKELELYNPDLMEKPELIVINKADLFLGQPQFLRDVRVEFRKLLKDRHPEEPLLVCGIPVNVFTN